MLVSEIGRNGSIFNSEGPPPLHFRGGESLYGAKFQVASRGLVSSAKL
jgi:hypothetical protein